MSPLILCAADVLSDTMSDERHSLDQVIAIAIRGLREPSVMRLDKVTHLPYSIMWIASLAS